MTPMLLAMWLITGAASGSPAAGTAVPVWHEPHHHLVWEDGPVRVLDIRIEPGGDTTLYHTHDAAILYVPIAISPTDAQDLGGPWGGYGPDHVSRHHMDGTEIDTIYATQPLTHRVTNVGRGLFHLVAIENGHTPAGSDHVVGGHAPPGTLQRRSRWFIQTRLTLAPGARSAWYTSPSPLVIVQPMAGRADVERGAGAAAGVLESPGDFAGVPAHSRVRVRNSGTESVTLVLVQAR
jgi:hypothetical protein